MKTKYKTMTLAEETSVDTELRDGSHTATQQKQMFVVYKCAKRENAVRLDQTIKLSN